MPTFSANPDYREYERLLREVHRLIAQGQGDTTEADALREQMDTPAASLTREELSRLDGLSADLYMLQGKETPARGWERWPEEQLRADLREAWQWNDWGAMLTVLRRNAIRVLPAAQIAYFRGRAYSELGHPETALEFMRYAARLNPSLRYFELDLLRLVNSTEAVHVAKSALEASNETVALKSLAAGIVFQSTRHMSASEARPVYERIIRTLREALQHQAAHDPVLPTVLAHAFVTLGLALDALGRSDEALEAYDRAVRAEPDNDATLVGRGIANLKRKPNVALSDFQRAIALGTQAIVPYVAVGLEAMKAGRYHQAAEIINRIRKITTNRRALALASEWAGIIAAETGQPAELVRACFRIATELDPTNIHIQHNSEVFEERLRQANRGTKSPDQWAIDEPLDLHEARAQISEISRAPLAAVG